MFAPRYVIGPALLDPLKAIAVAVHDLNRVRIPPELHNELRAEARAAATHAATAADDDERAARTYHAARVELDARKPDARRFDEALVRDLHRRLMDGRLEPERCGSYRQEPAFVLTPGGDDVVYWPPYHSHVPHHLDALYAFVNENAALDPVLLAGVFAKQFRLIHPFARGNGRTARLACRLLLRRLEIAPFDLLVFERVWRHDPVAHHERLWEAGSFYDLDPDFGPWLEYVATGVLAELDRLRTEIETRRTRQLRLKAHHRILLEHLERHGSITDRDYAGLVERAKATRSLDFRLLLDQGLIERRGRGPAVYYVLAPGPGWA